MASNRKNDTFDAGQFGSLRYDFTAFGGKTGIIPDPSDELLQKFNDDYKTLLEEYGFDTDSSDIDMDDPDAVNEALEKSNDRPSFVQQQKQMVELIGDLCQDSPSSDEIMKLPFRVRQKYIVWLQRKLTSPEA